MRGKTVLVRTDLNVPMEGGRITDQSRIMRLLPTLTMLSEQGARVALLSHFGRPEGKFDPSLSLAPLVDALSAALKREVRFGVDCIGNAARNAVNALREGEIILLENLRFHLQEESGDEAFARELASLGEIYVNDAFSCSHRAHASITGIPRFLPSFAGMLLLEEVTALSNVFSTAMRPLAAVVGGSKVSTKLALLENLVSKVDVLVIGGAMANTFLHAQGIAIGRSLYEPKMARTAKGILSAAEKAKCHILLPADVVVAETLCPHDPCAVCTLNDIPHGGMIADVGPVTLMHYLQTLSTCRMVVWNGPVGAFEVSPFDSGTVHLARMLASLTRAGALQTIAGGGDTLAAIAHAGLSQAFTYLSTAGGAFLEWLEGKELPGITALLSAPARTLASA